MPKTNNDNTDPINKPAYTCIMCQKTLEHIKGKRIIAQRHRGIIISDIDQRGSAEYPRISYRLSEVPKKYLVVWGEELQNNDLIKRARNAYANGKLPWLCQVCSGHTCKACGTPLVYPAGADILEDDGTVDHAAILPASVKCLNPNCDYKN